MIRRLAALWILLAWAGSAAADDLTCAKPFSFVDRWTDTNGNSLYDDGEPYDPALTGFVSPDDIGLSLTLTVWNPQAPLAEQRYVFVAFPPLGDGTPQTGGAWLRKWVSECAPYAVSSGDSLLVDPGNLLTELFEELDALIAADPSAHWDDATRTVQGSAFSVSPRVLAVACFDPRYPPTPSQQYVRVTKIAVVFLESTTPPTSIQVRFVDHASETVATQPTTWGRIKDQYHPRD